MRQFRCGCLIACVGVINALTQAVDAGFPSVQFDVAPTIECRDVTPAKFTAANPDERLVEAAFEVSSLIRGDNKDDLIETFYEVVCRRKDCKVVDYLPRTKLATNLAGNIGIEKRQEQVRSLGIGVSGVLESVVKINGTGNVGSKQNSSVRYELLPPMDTVAASGTTGRSTGVYFKLRSSRQTSLEGSKQFVLVLRVPRSWRGDLLYMRCRAVGLQSSLLKECRISQSSDFVIALYLERDAESKSRAAAYVEAERQLRRIATAHRDEINNRRWPSLMHKLGRAVNAVEPKIPVDWLHQFIHARAPDTLPQFQRHLPKKVHSAAERFRRARQTLCGS